MVGHPVELPAMRADGSEFPVEIAITRPRLAGPAACSPASSATSPSAGATSRRCASLADEQAALRRVATTVASEARPGERVFAVVTEEVGRLLGAKSANMVRYEPDGTAVVVGGWSAPATCAACRSARASRSTAPTRRGGSMRSGTPERVDSYEGLPGTRADLLRDLGFRCGGRRAGQARRAGSGAP